MLSSSTRHVRARLARLPLARAFSAAPADALPSFSRGLFAGKLNTASVHPYPPQDVMGDEQRETLKMLVEPTQQFFAEVNDAAANDEAAAIPEKTLKGLRELGAYGMQVRSAFAAPECARARARSPSLTPPGLFHHPRCPRSTAAWA